MTNHDKGGALLGIVERIEDLEADKAAIQAQIREVKAEAKSRGFEVKVINAVLSERRMGEYERREFQSLLEMYRGALGMLGDTPLGEAARRRMMGEEPEPPEEGEEAKPAPPDHDLEAAREAGREAARNGERIIDNPHVAGDPRRAAWDEGWCQQTGTDGMEVPDAWRRKSKKKKGDDDGKEGEA